MHRRTLLRTLATLGAVAMIPPDPLRITPTTLNALDERTDGLDAQLSIGIPGALTKLVAHAAVLHGLFERRPSPAVARVAVHAANRAALGSAYATRTGAALAWAQRGSLMAQSATDLGLQVDQAGQLAYMLTLVGLAGEAGTVLDRTERRLRFAGQVDVPTFRVKLDYARATVHAAAGSAYQALAALDRAEVAAEVAGSGKMLALDSWAGEAPNRRALVTLRLNRPDDAAVYFWRALSLTDTTDKTLRAQLKSELAACAAGAGRADEAAGLALDALPALSVSPCMSNVASLVELAGRLPDSRAVRDLRAALSA